MSIALFVTVTPIFVNNPPIQIIMYRILWLVVTLGSLSVRAQKTDQRLQKEIEQLLTGFNGSVGVYVHDLKKNRIAAVNADTRANTHLSIWITLYTSFIYFLTGYGAAMHSKSLPWSNATKSFLLPAIDVILCFLYHAQGLYHEPDGYQFQSLSYTTHDYRFSEVGYLCQSRF